MKNNNDFEFKYSAPTAEERKEIESIRNSYVKKASSSNKLDKLRRLDSKVKNIPTILSLCVAIIGMLIFGLGMAMVLQWNLIVIGIIVGVIGVIVMAIAYPLFIKISKYLKNKYSDTIIKLSEELLNNEK